MAGWNQGAVLWLTGLSGVGKTTLAYGARDVLYPGTRVEVLDGDDLRAEISPELGFTRKDRDIQVHRAGFIARLLARNGVLSLVALVSPYRQARDSVRLRCEDAHVPFMEVHLFADLSVLHARDPKGLYARAARGELAGLTGVSDPYEAPMNAELAIDTGRASREQCTAQLIAMLRSNRESVAAQ